jgi:hypothetical protein
MNQPMTNDSAPATNATMEIPTDLKRHPVRGFLWGLFTGLGLALVLVITKVITLGIVPIVVTIVVVALLCTIWGLVGPAKKAKGPIPVVITPSPTPPPSRFDDFADSSRTPVAPVPEPVEAPGDVAAEAADQAPKPDTSVFDAPPADAASADPADPAASDDN